MENDKLLDVKNDYLFKRIFGEDEEKVKSEVLKLLRIKYALIIVNENPLEFKKIDY